MGEKIRVEASSDLELTMSRSEGNNERLGIRSEYPLDDMALGLFRGLGLMHLVAPYLPDKIQTDFTVIDEFQNLIGAMYAVEGRESPKFLLTKRPEAPLKIQNRLKADENRASVAYSGGKDSMWNLDWLLSEYGRENVLAVHIKGMNRANFADEYLTTLKQSQAWGFQLKVIDLLNSSKSFGKSVMRSRDMFIIGMIIPLALKFGASKVILEGRYSADDNQHNPFTTYESSWNQFNQILGGLGLPIEVVWRDRDGVLAVADLAMHHPEWLPLVVNCFSPKPHRRERREKWQRVAPSFPLFETQCGSCVKCREFNIGRIDNDPSLSMTTEGDIKALVADTISWTKQHEIDQADIIGGAFTTKLKMLARRFGLEY